MWSKGKMDGYDYCVKHYNEGSQFGINEGRISKLEIRKDGKALVSYERGWDLEPQDDEVKTVYERILKKYN